MLCINTFGRVRYFPDQAKKKIQNGRTSTIMDINIIAFLLTFRVAAAHSGKSLIVEVLSFSG